MFFRLSKRSIPPQAGEESERSELPLTLNVNFKCIRCAHPLTPTLSRSAQARQVLLSGQDSEREQSDDLHTRFFCSYTGNSQTV